MCGPSGITPAPCACAGYANALVLYGTLPAYFFTGSCQRLALLRECPPACGLPLDFASQSKSPAGSCWLGWGRSPLIIVLCCLGWFLAAKSAVSQHGVCASSYYFHSEYFATAAKLELCLQVRPIVSSADGCMPSGRFQCTPLLRAHLACTHQQPVTEVARRSNPTRAMHPAAHNQTSAQS